VIAVADVEHHSFANFVEGPANADAVAAARAAASPPEEPGEVLIVSGGVGLGKTHLLRAVVNEARHHGLGASYLTVGHLIQRMLRSLDRDRLDDVENWLGRFAVLAVDDLDGMARRPRLGTEIARLLGRLQRRCRQLVLGTGTGDAVARLLPLEARLVELGVPDEETCFRIVTTHAERAGAVVPADVARLIAARCAGNVRGMEGALVRLGAYVLITQQPITFAEAEEVLEPVLPARAPALASARPPRQRRSAARTPGTPAELLAGIAELIEFAREVGGGKIGNPDVRGRDVYVRLVARDEQAYVLRLRVGTYLEKPLCCDFVNDAYRRSTSAWPYPDECGPFRSPDFICMPPVAEFYGYHPERTYRHGEGSFTATVAAVFAALHAPEYAGRFTTARQREIDGW
jgi:Bacterial DnaA ATPAse domain